MIAGFGSFILDTTLISGLGGGTISPISPLAATPITVRTIVSGLDIRSEAQRLRVESPSAKTVAEVRNNVAKAFDRIQSHADVTDKRFRDLSTNLNSIGLQKDPAGNITLAGATFAVRAGTEQFLLANGGMRYGVSNVAPNDADIPLGHLVAWVNEATDELTFRVRYSTGVLKTGIVALV